MKEVKAVIRPHRLDAVLHALHLVGDLPNVAVSEVRIVDVRPGFFESDPMAKIELMVPDGLVRDVVAAIQQAAHSGTAGDGRIFVLPVESTVLIRTGQGGEDPR